jgi:hypothetical protein
MRGTAWLCCRHLYALAKFIVEYWGMPDAVDNGTGNLGHEAIEKSAPLTEAV